MYVCNRLCNLNIFGEKKCVSYLNFMLKLWSKYLISKPKIFFLVIKKKCYLMSNFILCQLIHKYKTLLLVKMARKKRKKKENSIYNTKKLHWVNGSQNTFSFNFIVLQTRSALYIF